MQTKNNKTVVISLMKRDAKILAGQEIRWGRIAKALAEISDIKIKILCTYSIWKSWERYGLGEITQYVDIYIEHPNKYLTWLHAQYFALSKIPSGALLHIPGPGWLIAPAAIFAHIFKKCPLITSLTTSRLKPLRKSSRREYMVSLALCKMSNIVDSLNPKIDLDGLVNKAKVSISPCSFSDPQKYYPSQKKMQKVVFAGHLQANKGAEILIEIVKIWPNNSDYTFVICGASTISEEVEEYTKKIIDIAFGKSNIIIQRSDNMSEIFFEAKVFLSLQTWDNYPSQSLIEAMLSGCNIVATATGDTGMLVKQPWGEMLPLDAPAEHYLDCIMKFLRLPDSKQKEYGDAARMFIMNNHTIEKYIHYLRHLWNQLL